MSETSPPTRFGQRSFPRLAALDSYIEQNPQPLKPGDDEFYRSLCDAIGIKEPDLNAIKMEVWNEVFPPFKKRFWWSRRRSIFSTKWTTT